MDTGSRIAGLRRSLGMSQEALADRVGVSRQAVAKWEAGDSLPESAHLVDLADALRVRVDRLLRDAEGCGECADKDRAGGHGALVPAAWVDFLCRAKKAAYAGGGPEEPSSRPGSRDLRYGEGDLLYLDSYLGGECFAGEEALWLGGRPVWSMNYCGRVLDEGFSGDFLKECLGLVSPEYPFRGPPLHRVGDWTWVCGSKGSMDWFEGSEAIFLGGRRVYECRFHGGVLR